MLLFRSIASCLVLSLGLLSCDSTSNTATGPTGLLASIRGSVLLQDGKGLAGARVRLHSTGAVTMTGADGSWSLPGSASAVAARAEAGTDSVTVSKDSQIIASQAVTSSELPPLYLVQRDIFGSLSAPIPGHTYTITAKLTLPDGSVKDIGLWHNAVANSFSGFIYTVVGTGVQNYSVQVQVRDTGFVVLRRPPLPDSLIRLPDTAIVGIGPAVPFTSAAGDILIPAFSYANVGYKLLTKAPADSIAFKSSFSAEVAVSDTTVAGIGLHAPYQFSYRVGSGAWVSGKPSALVLDTALVRNPVVTVKVVDGVGGTLIDSIPIPVRGLRLPDHHKLRLEPGQAYRVVIDTPATVLKYKLDTTLRINPMPVLDSSVDVWSSALLGWNRTGYFGAGAVNFTGFTDTSWFAGMRKTDTSTYVENLSTGYRVPYVHVNIPRATIYDNVPDGYTLARYRFKASAPVKVNGIEFGAGEHVFVIPTRQDMRDVYIDILPTGSFQLLELTAY